MFAGMVTFRRYQPSKKKFALIGLLNFLTFIGFVYILYNRKIDDRFTASNEDINPKKTSEEKNKIIFKIIKITLLLGAIGFFLFTFILGIYEGN